MSKKMKKTFLSLGLLSLVAFTPVVVLQVVKRSQQKDSGKSKGESEKSAENREASLQRKVNLMSEGKKVRVVWMEQIKGAKLDPHAKSEEFHLSGYDSQEGGYRVILKKPGNYTRPLMTPDGQHILYSNKGTTFNGTTPIFQPTIHLLKWDGTEDRVLQKGYCVDVLRDAAGVTWVYALETLNSKLQFTLDGETLFRFPLDQPDKKEMLWSKTSLSLDNLQVSRDGRYFAGLFPWPEGGVGDLQNKQWQEVQKGCWTSLAPDNSYVMWLFSGTHKKLTMHDLVGKRTWDVKLNKAPGMGTSPSYHPRWSNHPRFFTVTGPYPSQGNHLEKEVNQTYEGGYAEIYLAKFSPKLEKVEQWAKITPDDHGHFAPDAWIEGGDETVLSDYPQSAELKIEPKSSEWPKHWDGLQFYWGNLETANQIEGRHMNCRALAKGIARFSRNKALLLDGGWFETDTATQQSLQTALPAATGMTVECLLSESLQLAGDESANLLSLTSAQDGTYWELLRKPEALVLRIAGGGFAKEAQEVRIDLPYQGAGVQHLALQFTPQEVKWYINGVTDESRKAAVVLDFAAVRDGKFLIGQRTPTPRGWSGSLKNVALYATAIPHEMIEAHAKSSRPVPMAELAKLRVKAKLVQSTAADPSQLGSYDRMLVSHTYEVVEVLEGTYAEKQILVMHWGILDRTKVSGLPTKLGEISELNLEPFEAHEQLGSELQLSDSEDVESVLYLDMAVPKLQP
jgi:hypothetical protein